MGLAKKDIALNINNKTQLSLVKTQELTNKFFQILSDNIRSKTVKLSNFGSFTNYVSPERIGRNPATKKEFIISKKQTFF